MDRKKFHCTY